jgi:hypothetical protein
LTQKNQKVKENLKALRWSFFAPDHAIRATTIPPVIAQEAAAPNFPLPSHFYFLVLFQSLSLNLKS